MKYEESDLFNFQIFLMALKSNDKVVDSNPSLHIGSMMFKDLQITINDCSLNDPMLVSSPLNLNISHMKLIDIMASADSIGFHLDSLKADSSIFLNTEISDLKGSFGITRDQIDLREMYLKWGETEINSEINLSLTSGDWVAVSYTHLTLPTKRIV